ncbi:CLUMA_CG018685, isoform A [Clunio marinus]|uniref:CLUMA_CG018685, isoform A n=1 Tax=Clunio marinus TaxID=568069 RepID=A0A1J1J462_9DIPT|nr:CLUMA_CG018685, isoform A [Clunio marinus]
MESIEISCLIIFVDILVNLLPLNTIINCDSHFHRLRACHFHHNDLENENIFDALSHDMSQSHPQTLSADNISLNL